MRRVRRAHYGALVGVALVVAPLLVTVAGEWQAVQSVLGVVAPVLVLLLVLKAFSLVVIILLRSVC